MTNRNRIWASFQVGYQGVDWAELADEADDGVRRPGRQKEQGLRQQTERRPQFCPPTVFYKWHSCMAERHSAITGQDQSRHLLGWPHDEPEDGAVTEN